MSFPSVLKEVCTFKTLFSLSKLWNRKGRIWDINFTSINRIKRLHGLVEILIQENQTEQLSLHLTQHLFTLQSYHSRL